MRALLCGAVIGATIAGACTDVSTDPNAIVALSFDSLPYPVIVQFDTLRDEEGVARPLRAIVLNPNGEEIDGASVQFITTTGGVTISDEGYVISTEERTEPVALVAQVSGLQSRALTLLVTVRPDSVAADGVVDTLRYVLPDDNSNTSAAVRMQVLSNTEDPAVPVRGWIVRYTLEYRGIPLDPNDTDIAWLVDESNQRSREDTTTADGIASRRVRVRATGLAAEQDSIIVIATARAYGGPLTGSPVRVAIPVIPR